VHSRKLLKTDKKSQKMPQNARFVMFFAIKYHAWRGIVSVRNKITVGTGEIT
jgi:hypothetical protein